MILIRFLINPLAVGEANINLCERIASAPFSVISVLDLFFHDTFYTSSVRKIITSSNNIFRIFINHYVYKKKEFTTQISVLIS